MVEHMNLTKALEMFEEQFNQKVQACGMFIRPDLCQLAASPDGVVAYILLADNCLDYAWEPTMHGLKLTNAKHTNRIFPDKGANV